MNENSIPSRTSTLVAALTGLFGFLMKYAAYNFFAAVVLLCFGALAFAYITFFGPKMPFLSSLSLLIPVDSNGTVRIGPSDILRAYSLLSLVLMGLGMAAKGLIAGWRRWAHRMGAFDPAGLSTPMNLQTPRQYINAGVRRIIFGCGAITLIFLAAFAAIPSAKMAEGASRVELFGIFGFFFVVAIGSNGIHVLIDGFSDFILDWARANFPWATERGQVL